MKVSWVVETAAFFSGYSRSLRGCEVEVIQRGMSKSKNKTGTGKNIAVS